MRDEEGCCIVRRQRGVYAVWWEVIGAADTY